VNVVWLDGIFLSAEEAKIPALSPAVLYGEGLFETLRVYGGYPFGLDQHLSRMRASAAVLGLPVPATLGRIGTIARELVERNQAPECVLRVTALTGVGGTAHLLLSLRPLPQDLRLDQERGVAAATAGAGRFPLAAHKTTSYLRYLEAARASGAWEAILTQDGQVLEGSRSNVFAVLRRELVTPPADGHILAGITRRILLGLAAGADLAPRERPLALAELSDCRALLLTNSVIEVVPVAALDGRPVGAVRDPSVVCLQELYRERVRTEAGA
jgi:D-alanine transaminase